MSLALSIESELEIRTTFKDMEVNDMLVEIKSSELPSLVRLEARGEAKAEAFKDDAILMVEDDGLDVKQMEEKMLLRAPRRGISIDKAKSLIAEAKADLTARCMVQ